MLSLLYQDEHLLVVEKPVGLSAQEMADGRDSLPRRLSEQGFPVYPVHRLDRPTGGVMVYARNPKTAAGLSRLVGDHDRFLKEYLAVVTSAPPAEGILTDLLYHDVKRNKSYTVKKERKGVRLAKLSYEVVHTADTPEGSLSLIWVRLHTGRTHQIRVQFASRGMPLYGDTRYGGPKGDTLGLWSHRLTFPHPITGEMVKAESRPDTTLFPWCLFRDHL